MIKDETGERNAPYVVKKQKGWELVRLAHARGYSISPAW
jgi:hypothetical protein